MDREVPALESQKLTATTMAWAELAHLAHKARADTAGMMITRTFDALPVQSPEEEQAVVSVTITWTTAQGAAVV